MSNAVFPSLEGRSWNSEKTPIYEDTVVITTRAGIEKRAAYSMYPRYIFSISYEIIEDNKKIDGDFQRIIGFFLARHGNFESFLYEDPDDHQIVNQVIGIGDGMTKSFQLIRTLGEYAEPIRNIKTISSVKIGESDETAFIVDSSGRMIFNTAPPKPSPIIVTADFYFRCRFNPSKITFKNFLKNLYELQSLELISLK
ncbi:MAG: DUF2460 domain-containing protein [Bacillota bacterium]|nr:DUF2460 domain-containing protein [Bacillota bacterium]